MEQKANGYGYEYPKVRRDRSGQGRVTRSIHRLKNTGEKPIVTDFYNHNFFNVDGDPVGPNYSFVFPFEVKAKDLRGKFGELVELKDKELRFKDKLTDGFVMAGLTGFDPEQVRHRGFEMRHAPSGVRVECRHSIRSRSSTSGASRRRSARSRSLRSNLKPGEREVWGIGTPSSTTRRRSEMRPADRRSPVGILLSRARDQPVTAIRFGFTASTFGSRIVSTPDFRSAVILSAATVSATANTRW